MITLDSDLTKSALALIEGEPNRVANLANLSALIFHSMPGLNWAGFYLWDDHAHELVLGPFQGKPACLRIKPDRGVCGKAYTTKQVQRVHDVHAFPGHIACDPASKSELVIPLLWKGECVGVLDLDAPTVGRFTEAEAESLKQLMEAVVNQLWEVHFWKKKWELGEIAFHADKPNPHLIQFFKNEPPGKVMVPLCGKTTDMLWLRSQGHQVVGIELSAIACEAFFKENHLPYQKRPMGKFTVYEGEGITIWCGDLFETGKEVWGEANTLYDRAALIALPEDLRQKYVHHILEHKGKIQTILLDTIDYQSPKLIGPPFSVAEKEVRALYGKSFEIKKVYSNKDPVMTNRSGKFEGIQVQEEVFRLTLKIS